MAGEVTDELNEIYRNAKDDGIWLREFAPGPGGKYLAAAGSIKEVEGIEKKLGKEIDIEKLSLGDIVNISMPGTGETREEACSNAVVEYKRHLKKDENPYDKLERYFSKYAKDSHDLNSKEYFSAAVKVAMEEYDLSKSDIAREFQVADSTVRRWANGVSVPHPRLREKILEWIVKKI